MSNGIYMGTTAMAGEKGHVVQGLKHAIKDQEAQMARARRKRGFWGNLGNIFKTILPGAGHILDGLITQIAQHNIDLTDPQKVRDKETIWTEGAGGDVADQLAEIEEGENLSWGETITDSALGFLTSNVGGKFLDKVGVGNPVDKFRTSLFDDKGFDLPDFLNVGGWGVEKQAEGGIVPTYKKGGKVKKGGRKITKKDIEGFRALKELFATGDPKVTSGKSMFTKGGGYSKDYFAEKLGISPENLSIDTLSYSDPSNFDFMLSGDGKKSSYQSQGSMSPRKGEYMHEQAALQALLREALGNKNYMDVMGDLLNEKFGLMDKKVDDKYYDMDTFDQMDYDFKKEFAGGGQVPTISDFFNMQGKSLGGSNKQSLAEMLGRK